MTVVKFPFASFSAKKKTTIAFDDSDATYDPVKKVWTWKWPYLPLIGLENGKSLLQETGRFLETEWGYKYDYREKPTSKGRRLVRQKHSIPYNPQTTPQQENRGKFGSAIDAWQDLTYFEEIYWNKLVYPAHMSGYNRFIRAFMLDQI